MAKSVQKISLSASRDIPFDKLVLSQSNVRHVKADEELNWLERPGFAWEFLRRNKTYRAAYERMSRQDPRLQQADANPARRWGLVFRPKPETWRHRNAGLLAA